MKTDTHRGLFIIFHFMGNYVTVNKDVTPMPHREHYLVLHIHITHCRNIATYFMIQCK